MFGLSRKYECSKSYQQLSLSLQSTKDLLAISWRYSVAFDSSTYQSSSYFDIRLRVYVKNSQDVINLHVLALDKLFTVLNPAWKSKLVGVTTDGAANMPGCHRGVATLLQEQVLPGFYRVGAHYTNWTLWCKNVSQDISMTIFILN